MERGGLRYPKAIRVRTKSEIDRVFCTGARYSCKGMRLHVAANTLGNSRAVFVPVKSFDGSVRRNRAKRVAREGWRLGFSGVRAGYDLAFVLYPEEGGARPELEDYRSRMRYLLKKAGLLEGAAR